jgi:hypothetical protein
MDLHITASPESGQVSGNLNGASGWAEQMKQKRHLAVANRRGFSQTEQLLDADRQKRWLVNVIFDTDARATRHIHGSWHKTRELLLLLPVEPVIEDLRQINPLQLLGLADAVEIRSSPARSFSSASSRKLGHSSFGCQVRRQWMRA